MSQIKVSQINVFYKLDLTLINIPISPLYYSDFINDYSNISNCIGEGRI